MANIDRRGALATVAPSSRVIGVAGSSNHQRVLIIPPVIPPPAKGRGPISFLNPKAEASSGDRRGGSKKESNRPCSNRVACGFDFSRTSRVTQPRCGGGEDRNTTLEGANQAAGVKMNGLHPPPSMMNPASGTMRLGTSAGGITSGRTARAAGEPKLRNCCYCCATVAVRR